MTRTFLYNVEFTAAEFREFLPKYEEFMDGAIKPGFIGVAFVNYVAEVKAGGIHILAETNKKLNQGSRQMLMHLTSGFIGGYTARGKG
jgi:hypothetical protein